MSSSIYHDEVAQAVRNFVNTGVPLDVDPNDRQPASGGTRPEERSGSILLPLWRQTATMHRNSPHWLTFNNLLNKLGPYLSASSTFMDALNPEPFKDALAAWTSERATMPYGERIEPRAQNNCYETFRLRVNEALPLTGLTTSHPSGHFALYVVGQYSGGKVVTSYGSRTAQRGDFISMSTAVLCGSQPFTGYRYALEFYLSATPPKDLSGNDVIAHQVPGTSGASAGPSDQGSDSKEGGATQ